MLTLVNVLGRLSRRSFTFPTATQDLTSWSQPGDVSFEPLSSKLLQALSWCIPALTYDKHKGYTGAPHYAAISALKCGADLATIITTESAAIPIKSYNPEHIVLPWLEGEDAVKNIIDSLPKFHSVVLGPGLGRDSKQLQIAERLIYEIKERGLPLVIDADGMYLITQKPDIIKGYDKVILTPNAAEFDRLYTVVLQKAPTEGEPIIDVKRLARKLQVTILRKGFIDIISDGSESLVVNTEVSPRRSGGQGDILAGLLGVFNYWMHVAQSMPHMINERHMGLYGPTLLAAVSACALTRECNKAAFDKHGRSTLATDMIDEIGTVFVDIFGKDRTAGIYS
ncbi:ATP-dependent (S)-NAD(P)H-hydrate dehydratase-like isoform X2 [Watersipora subatra]|uniref:ATP-dependent (S)-NAD(P)H-hydrate dehydratase-like isoform X2 n=1 Tax=Watersipora subatra TaxID=2589382 RepID=UPI00355C552F